VDPQIRKKKTEFYDDIIFEVHEDSKSFCVTIGSRAHQSVQKVY